MRKLLIVIDMQNDFIDAALGTKEAVEIVDAVKEKIRSYPAENVIATMDTHAENYLKTQEGRNLPVVHCVKGTDGWQIRPEIADLLKDRARTDRPVHGYLRGFQRAPSQSVHAGSKDHGRRGVLRRRYTRKACSRARDDAVLPDPCDQRLSARDDAVQPDPCDNRLSAQAIGAKQSPAPVPDTTHQKKAAA